MKIKFAVLLALLITNISAWAQSNKFDDKGKRHGKWGDVYDTTKLPRYEGTFEHGKETGIFKFYQNDKNSTLIATRDFSAGNGTSYTIFYDENGKKLSEGKEVNRLREGEWKFYHPGKEAILSIEHYSKGKLTGVKNTYFPNGAIAEEAEYKNGMKDGVYKKYTEKGIVLEESVYKNDELNGLAIYRNAEGEVVSKGQFANNVKTGIWKYFEKGKLVKEEDKTNLKIELKRIRE